MQIEIIKKVTSNITLLKIEGEEVIAITEKCYKKNVVTKFNRNKAPNENGFIITNMFDYDIYAPIDHGHCSRVTAKLLGILHNEALTDIETKLVEYVNPLHSILC
jgi:hypothetical protein